MKVDEIFGPTIQGEGALAGAVTMFVRLGGCDYRCSWCDTMHAVDESYAYSWRTMTPHEAAQAVADLTPKATGTRGMWVTISGGNPAIWQKELPELVAALQAMNYRVNIETQGSVPNEAFGIADMVTISPKGPSSGMTLDRAKLRKCVEQSLLGRAVFKFVVANEKDFGFAMLVSGWHPGIPVYVQPITVVKDGQRVFDYRWLCEKVARLAELTHWRVIPQLHILAWAGERGR